MGNTVAVGDGLIIPSTTEWIGIGRKQWRGERDDYRRGKRPIYVDVWDGGPEFPEPSEAFMYVF